GGFAVQAPRPGGSGRAAMAHRRSNSLAGRKSGCAAPPIAVRDRRRVRGGSAPILPDQAIVPFRENGGSTPIQLSAAPLLAQLQQRKTPPHRAGLHPTS